MKFALLRIIPFIALTLISVQAADDPKIATLRAADDERTAAIIAADKDRLTALFSDDLRYAHSTGGVDTKASYVDSLTSGRTKYLAIEYEERNFTFPAPGIALMTGRARIKATSGAGTMDNVLGFLAVWREENGKWRFYAWQSCKLPPAVPATK